MRLFLVRHAKTDAERNGFRQAQDIPLSDEGIKQALAIAKRLKKEKIEIVFSSPIARAKETAEIIASKNKLPLKALGLLCERKHDVRLEGARIDSEINKKYFKELSDNFYSFDWKFLDDEPLSSVAERAKKVRKLILEKYGSKNIVLVSHAIFFRCFIPICILGDEFEKRAFMRMFHFCTLSHGSLSLLKYNEGKEFWEIGFLNESNFLRRV